MFIKFAFHNGPLQWIKYISLKFKCIEKYSHGKRSPKFSLFNLNIWSMFGIFVFISSLYNCFQIGKRGVLCIHRFIDICNVSNRNLGQGYYFTVVFEWKVIVLKWCFWWILLYSSHCSNKLDGVRNMHVQTRRKITSAHKINTLHLLRYGGGGKGEELRWNNIFWNVASLYNY